MVQKGTASLASVLTQCMGGLCYQSVFVQFDGIKRIVWQSKAILVDQLCIAMLACM